MSMEIFLQRAENEIARLHSQVEEWKELNRQRVNEIEKLIAEKRELQAENERLKIEARASDPLVKQLTDEDWKT